MTKKLYLFFYEHDVGACHTPVNNFLEGCIDELFEENLVFFNFYILGGIMSRIFVGQTSNHTRRPTHLTVSL